MLNSTGITKTTYNDVPQILIAPELAFSMGIVVDETCGTVDSTTGRKIAKAGTPVTGSLDDRVTTPFTKAQTTTGTSNAVGILLHDVDLTKGDNNGAILVFGFVNTNRLDATTKALITAEVKAALPKITFVAC
jgi:hypothetical protein